MMGARLRWTRIDVPPRQVLIRWAVQRGTSVLPKSTHPDRLRSNIDVLGWSLPQEDFELLSSLPTQTRMVRSGVIRLDASAQIQDCIQIE